ncbi:lysophospholipid acyltransferase family protein [Rubellicoccus peritrichatus]|uniref:Lysophospholipid acyltransferase family protein n=1 Tax=Rubellicoccus peritrichatus TaxID=3080537 RepID=A0AAQ3LB64_9BACT|nr:lysophospholipid acyltransferase family protein [Puniceicoccus sp. CR14]WOO42501.1 lysophospholipid acyltransferase family protein [Puniceicoccus sp. CR14]
MIKEKPNRFCIGLLDWYLTYQFRRRFFSVHVDGFDGFDAFFKDAGSFPILFYGNHQSWWDGFFAFQLARRYGIDQRVIMEEKNLQRFPFFRYVGVFGVDLDLKEGRAQSLMHCVRTLKVDKPRRALLMYPQGRLVSPLEKAWPPFKPGIETILKLCPAVKAVPIIHEIVSGKHQLPEVFIEIGQPISAANQPDATVLEAALKDTREIMIEKVLAGSVPQNGFYLSKPAKHMHGETGSSPRHADAK